jgi:Tfp pilus assembly protein PilF
MQKTLLTLALLVIVKLVPAQTAAEMEKLLKEQQRVTDSLMQVMQKEGERILNDPEVKKALQQGASPSTYTVQNDHTDVLKLPKKNTRLLQQLPKAVLSKTQLPLFVQNIKSQLQQKVSPSKLAAVKSALTKLSNEPAKLHSAAIATWYSGAQQEAMLLLLTAAEKKPDDALLLNNIAALLNMGGAPQKAIPILQSLLVTYPENPFVLNNLGQSFASLGERDTALYYLSRCLKVTPLHAAANHTAGIIATEKGNKSAAENYFTNELKATGSAQAAAALRNVSPQKSIANLLRPKVKMPDYFNPYKYHLPQQCENVLDVEKAKSEHEEFRNWLMKTREAYTMLRVREEELGKQELMNAAKKYLANPKQEYSLLRNPFVICAIQMLSQLTMEAISEKEALNSFIEAKEKLIDQRLADYKIEFDKIEADYIASYPKARKNIEGDPTYPELERKRCHNHEESANRCLKDMAQLRRSIQEKQLHYATWFYENYAFWGYLAGPTKHVANAAFYKAAESYLDALKQAATTATLAPYCTEVPVVTAKDNEADKAASMNCPFNISIDIVIAKLQLDCERFQFSGGEGLRFNYEKEFETGNSTISIGAGFGFDFSRGAIVEAGGSIGAEQSFYISFDGNNQITDLGIQFNVGASLEAGFSAGNGVVQMDKGFIDAGVNAGYSIGINSGINFTGNVFKMLN